jgi:predicted metalloprotease
MTKVEEIEKQIKELRLQKRQLLLSGKETEKVDYEIEDLEGQLKL